MSQFFASGGQSIGASTSASVLPMNIHFLLIGNKSFPMISFRIDWFDLLAVQVHTHTHNADKAKVEN